VKHIAPVALVVALVVAMTVLPACAQHGASHGGFSGHAAAPSRGGFAASAPGRSSGYRSFGAPRTPGVARGLQRGTYGAPSARQPYTGSWRYRRPYASPYRAGFAYAVPAYGWVPPYFLGYPDDGYDDSGAPPDNGSAYAPDGYAEPQEPDPEPDQAQYQQQAPLAPWRPAPEAYQPAPAPAIEQAVTLIFKDGRPAEHIHNYLLTPTTLYVGDQHHRAIPTDELDLVATAKANQDAGVDFQLPNSLK
jgi:hypothetical protein